MATETVRELATLLAVTQAERDAAAEAAQEARSVLAQVLFHVTGGKPRKWSVPADVRHRAAAEVLAVGWDDGPAGSVAVTLEIKDATP